MEWGERNIRLRASYICYFIRQHGTECVHWTDGGSERGRAFGRARRSAGVVGRAARVTRAARVEGGVALVLGEGGVVAAAETGEADGGVCDAVPGEFPGVVRD